MAKDGIVDFPIRVGIHVRPLEERVMTLASTSSRSCSSALFIDMRVSCTTSHWSPYDSDVYKRPDQYNNFIGP